MSEEKRIQPGWALRVKCPPGVYMGLLRQQAATFTGSGPSNRETLAQTIERGFIAYDHPFDPHTGERVPNGHQWADLIESHEGASK